MHSEAWTPSAADIHLPPSSPPHPQPQTFVPQFHWSQVLPLDLTPAALAALATSEARLDLWHHAPRSQAVAAALANGVSAAGSGAAAQQAVHLGTAACPLAQLLTRPQGVANSWLVLKSKRGQSVGAVQVSFYFRCVDGRRHDAAALAPSPLDSHPEWSRLLPPGLAALTRAAAPQAATASSPLGSSGTPPLPLTGQPARCSVFLEQVVLPAGGDTPLDSSCGSYFAASYRLPGSHADHVTAAAAPVVLPPEFARPAGADRVRGVPLRHCGVHWVLADGRLPRALLRHPLTVSVTRQQAVVGGGRAGGGEVVEVPVGSVEVDLSGLLAGRAGKDPATRCALTALHRNSPTALASVCARRFCFHPHQPPLTQPN
jgi:hypothetical protein